LEFEDDPRFNNNIRKKKTKKENFHSNDWLSKLKFFDKKPKVVVEEEGDEEQIEHVNLQNSVKIFFLASKLIFFSHTISLYSSIFLSPSTCLFL